MISNEMSETTDKLKGLQPRLSHHVLKSRDLFDIEKGKYFFYKRLL